MLCFCSLHLLPVVPDQVLLPGDLHFKDCCFSHTLTPGLANAGLRHIFQQSWKIAFSIWSSTLLTEYVWNTWKSASGAWFSVPPLRPVQVSDMNQVLRVVQIFESTFKDTHCGQVLLFLGFFLTFALTASPADAERGKWVRGEGNTFPIKDPCSPLERWDSNNQGSFWMFQHHSPNTHTINNHKCRMNRKTKLKL